MEEKKTTAVEMTAEQLAAFEAFQQEQAKKERQQKRKENRALYAQLVDEQIGMPYQNCAACQSRLR